MDEDSEIAFYSLFFTVQDLSNDASDLVRPREGKSKGFPNLVGFHGCPIPNKSGRGQQ